MSENNKLYTFTYQGKEYAIASIKHIPNGVIRKTRHITDEVDKSYTIIELIVGNDEELLEVFDTMTVEEFTNFIEDWAGTDKVGESSGSSS